MIQINLLPWREQARQIKKLHFLYSLVAAAGVAVLLILLLHFYYSSLVNYQERRNAFLQSELEREQAALNAMNEDKRKKAVDEEALRFLFAIRNDDYQIVSVLNHIANTIPEGIALKRIARKGKQLSIIGKADSNLQITLLMKNIEKPDLFKQPELTEISAKELGTGEERFFQLMIELNK